MSALQNWKITLVYIGVESLFGALCTMIRMLVSPVSAQSGKFGHIKCPSLSVVNAQAHPKAEIGVVENGGGL